MATKKTAKKPAKKASKKAPAKKPAKKAKPVKVAAKPATKARAAKKAPNPVQVAKPVTPPPAPPTTQEFASMFREIMFGQKPKRSAASLLGDEPLPPPPAKTVDGLVLREAIAEYQANALPGMSRRTAEKFNLNVGAFSIACILADPSMVENRAAVIAYLTALGTE